MKIKLGKIFIPISVATILLCFVVFLVVNSYFKNSMIEDAKEQQINKAKSNTRQDVELLHKTFRVVQPIINSLTPKIHSTILQNGSKENQYMHRYNDYSYSYIIFSHSSTLTDLKFEFSSLNDSTIISDITNYYSDMISNQRNISLQLRHNQVVNRITRINGVSYLVSLKSIIEADGQIVGAIVVLINLNEIIKIDDFIFNDGNRLIQMFSKYNKKCIYNSANNCRYKYDGKNSDAVLINGHIDTETQENTKEIICSSIDYYEPLDIILTSNSNSPIDTKNVINNSLIYYISIILSVIFIIVVILFTLTFFISKINYTINNKLNLVENIINNKYINALNIIKEEKKKKNVFLYNKKDLSQFIDKAEEFVKLGLSNSLNQVTGNGNTAIQTNNQRYINNCLIELNNIDKTNCISHIETISECIVYIKHNIQLLQTKIINIKESAVVNASIEVSANIIAINLAILCNQINDNRLNELLVLVKLLNNNIQNNNENLRKNSINKFFTDDKIANNIEQINSAIETLTSLEKNKQDNIANISKNLKMLNSSKK